MGGLVGAFAFLAPSLPEHSRSVAAPNQPVWSEVQWPFPMDEWGKGKAFRCKAADCGAEVNLISEPRLASAIVRQAYRTTTSSRAWATSALWATNLRF